MYGITIEFLQKRARGAMIGNPRSAIIVAQILIFSKDLSALIALAIGSARKSEYGRASRAGLKA
jgi:hypothetical protein